jgi:hypothetical protein
MTDAATSTGRAASDGGISNTDIVLVVLDDLGGADRPVHIEDIAEAAWQQVPARFSWPKLQKYPDLDAVDVTLRAAKKNEGLVPLSLRGPARARRGPVPRDRHLAGRRDRRERTLHGTPIQSGSPGPLVVAAHYREAVNGIEALALIDPDPGSLPP